MKNAELIAAMRYCKEHEACDHDASAECPYWHHWIDGEDCSSMLVNDAADALEAVEKLVDGLQKLGIAELMPKEGEWFKYNNPNYSPFDDSGEYLYQCNKCGKVVIQETNYCPNCGARMKGERNAES